MINRPNQSICVTKQKKSNVVENIALREPTWIGERKVG